MGTRSMKNAEAIGQKLLSKTIDWPTSWQCKESDNSTGVGLLNVLTPFLQHLVDSGQAPTTLRRHFGNIWLLGSEIIRQMDYDSSLRFFPGGDLVLKFIDEDGGPVSKHNSTEAELRSFDSSCRKLYAFLLAGRKEKQ